MFSLSFDFLYWGLIIVIYALGIIAGLHALMTKKDPRAAFGWLLLCLLFPSIGIILYVIFGLNRIRPINRKWESRGLWRMDQSGNLSSKSHEKTPISGSYLFHELNKTAEHVGALPLVANCHLDVLYDGSEAYPKMLKAIDNAKYAIYLQTYIFGRSGAGALFIDALIRAKNRGVDVRVIIDGVGSCYSWPSTYRQLKKNGIRVERFLWPLSSLYALMHLNLRNHRKILVIDGELAFTGGLNIHQDNMASNGKAAKIHDVHFLVCGPIVGNLQDMFLGAWFFITKEFSKTPVNFDTTPKGDAVCRAISAGPHQQFPQLQSLLCTAFSVAREKIQIMTPYFIPGRALTALANTAAMRGVKVEIILPKSNNLSLVKGASEANMPFLLEHGITVYYHNGNFSHTKLCLIDNVCLFLGSSNIDIRSLHLNFECNLEVYDQKLISEISQYFSDIKSHATEVTLKSLQSRPISIKLRNAFFKLFSLYL